MTCWRLRRSDGFSFLCDHLLGNDVKGGIAILVVSTLENCFGLVDGQDKIYIQSIGDLRVRNGWSDAYVFRNNDLLAVVKGAAGDLELGAGGITLE